MPSNLPLLRYFMVRSCIFRNRNFVRLSGASLLRDGKKSDTMANQNNGKKPQVTNEISHTVITRRLP